MGLCRHIEELGRPHSRATFPGGERRGVAGQARYGASRRRRLHLRAARVRRAAGRDRGAARRAAQAKASSGESPRASASVMAGRSCPRARGAAHRHVRRRQAPAPLRACQHRPAMAERDATSRAAPERRAPPPRRDRAGFAQLAAEERFELALARLHQLHPAASVESGAQRRARAVQHDLPAARARLLDGARPGVVRHAPRQAPAQHHPAAGLLGEGRERAAPLGLLQRRPLRDEAVFQAAREVLHHLGDAGPAADGHGAMGHAGRGQQFHEEAAGGAAADRHHRQGVAAQFAHHAGDVHPAAAGVEGLDEGAGLADRPHRLRFAGDVHQG